MDPNEITKVIDNVYKNILEEFNPSTKEIIGTGKAYLKALHGASAASSIYIESLFKVAKEAQETSFGASNDIGNSLFQAAQVFKEIHNHQLNTLKAFYVDFMVPIESNLEKDTRIIQNEQKKFMLCHKGQVEKFIKASSCAKKLKKKSRKTGSSTAIDKEIKIMQELEQEKTKLELFCEKSLNEALKQERRRYGFILERQASLAKHYLAFYGKGASLLGQKVEEWLEVAKSREQLPLSMQNTLLSKIQKGKEDDCIYCTPKRPSDDSSAVAQTRKNKSADESEISGSEEEMNPIRNGGTEKGMSGLNINGDERAQCLLSVTKALFAYLSSGENQLSFHEGDFIRLIGARSKGWQFGENLRTQKKGWFPVAYTEGPTSPPPSPLNPMPPNPPSLPSVNTKEPIFIQPSQQPPPKGMVVVSASIQTQTPGSASDSLHSSNDSGFSNDILKTIPPQPEIDYSEDEQQISNSGTLRSGDTWLMEKYHKDESVRMSKQSPLPPRRSQSFMHLGGVGNDEESEKSRSRPIRRHNTQLDSHCPAPGGALKKILSRTKSFIWKRSPSASPEPKRRISRPHVSLPLERFDSVSVQSIEFDQLWTKHLSMINVNESPPTEEPALPPPLVPLKESGGKQKKLMKSQSSQTGPDLKILIGKYAPPPPPLPQTGIKNKTNGEEKENDTGTENSIRKNKGRSRTGLTSMGQLRRIESEKIYKSPRLQRIESFSGSEAPIVPDHSASTSRKAGIKQRYDTKGGESLASENSEEELDCDNDGSSIFSESGPIPQNPVSPPLARIPSKNSKRGSLRLLTKSKIHPQSRKISPDSSICHRGPRFQGSIRSEVHTLELIGDGRESPSELPLFSYGSQIRKRLYFPERTSKMDQKSERTGNFCGPWYDLWGIDPSVRIQ